MGSTPRPTPSPLVERAPLVLCVEDDADTRALYVMALRSAGYRTIEAADGRDAVTECFAQRPDLVIVDLAVPGVDGWEVIRALKTDERTSGTPMLVVSGCVRPVDAERAREAGCDAFLEKPCEVDALLGNVRQLLTTSGVFKSRG